MVKVSELKKEQELKSKKRKNTYRKIYKQIENKIIFANKMDKTEIDYKIPEFIFGTTVYNKNSCVDYVVKKLHKDGFKVMKYGEVLNISWK